MHKLGLVDSTSGSWETGYWILDTGYWILDTRYQISDTETRYSILDTENFECSTSKLSAAADRRMSVSKHQKMTLDGVSEPHLFVIML